jgi:hypothetical protein
VNENFEQKQAQPRWLRVLLSMLTGFILGWPKKPRQVPIFLGVLTFFGMLFVTLIPFLPILRATGATWSNALQLLFAFCTGLSFLLIDWLRPYLGGKTPTGMALGVMLLPLVVYSILLVRFILVRRWISYAILCVILGCILFANVAGCRRVVSDLGHSLSQNQRQVNKSMHMYPHSHLFVNQAPPPGVCRRGTRSIADSSRTRRNLPA